MAILVRSFLYNLKNVWIWFNLIWWLLVVSTASSHLPKGGNNIKWDHVPKGGNDVREDHRDVMESPFYHSVQSGKLRLVLHPSGAFWWNRYFVARIDTPWLLGASENHGPQTAFQILSWSFGETECGKWGTHHVEDKICQNFLEWRFFLKFWPTPKSREIGSYPELCQTNFATWWFKLAQ